MKIERSLSLAVVIGLMSMVGALAYGQGQGKGGGKNKDETIIVGQLTIHDDYESADGDEARLISDMRTRTDGFGNPLPDGDGDGFSDLDLVLEPNAVYQDHRLPFDSSGSTVPPDPCVTVDVTDGGASAGSVNVDLDRGSGDAFRNCALFEDSGAQPLLDDARTFTLLIDKDPVDNPGGACVCQTFAFLVGSPEANGWPAGSEWGTRFEDLGGSCAITPAAGPILTNHDSWLTGNPRFTGHPFAEKKVKGKAQNVASTRINIPFTVDQPLPGDPDQLTRYNIRSVEEDVTIETVGSFPHDTVTMVADDQEFQLVEFSGNEPVCPGTFELPMKITVRRYELDASQ